MQKRFMIILFLSFLFTTWTYAQLVNNGATIIVKNGATLHVDSDVTNTTGTLQLESNATLEVSGDFTSETAASFDADANSTVKFFGSASKNIKSGGDDFGKILLNKDDAINMTLTDAMEITTNLDFTPANNNKLILGANNLAFASGATITNADATHYIQADGAGVVEKRFSADGSFTYNIGDSDEYSPVTANVSATSYGSAAKVAINVVDAVHPNLYSDANAYLTRYWNVDVTDITGYSATLTGTYTDADITGTETNIKGASYTSDWSFANAGNDDTNNTVTGDVTSSTDFSGMNFYGKMASLKAFLQGAYSGTEMTTTLNSSSLLPLTSPYGTGESVSSIPNANITDWIKIEIRDAADASNILKSYSKFINKDGQIYELDGTSTPKFKDAPTSGYIAIRHRNHLGIRTSSTLDFTANPSHDFTTASSQAYGTDPMKEVASGVWAMWGGNANQDAYVRAKQTFIPPSTTIYSDRDYILNDVLGGDTNGQSDTYNSGDVNMDGHVRAKQTFIPPSTTIKSDRDFILNDVLGGNANGQKDEQL